MNTAKLSMKYKNDEDIQAQYEAIKQKLADLDHYQKTPTRNYGEHDPSIVRIASCVCGKLPTHQSAVLSGKPLPSNQQNLRVAIRCECGNGGQGSVDPAIATLLWNKCPYAVKIAYQEFPLFGLKKLTPEEALEKVKAIHNDLTLRVEEANLKSLLGFERGKSYFRRLRLYQLWADWAIYCIKVSLPKANV